MPFIISANAGSVRLTHTAQADTRTVVRLTHSAQARTATQNTLRHTAQAHTGTPRSLAHAARAYTGSRLARLTHLASVQAAQLSRLEHLASASTGAAMPVTLRPGRRPEFPILSSNAGQVVSASYNHTGTRETLTLTVLGAVSPLPNLQLLAQIEQQGFLISLDGDLRQFESRQTSLGIVTTLYGENRQAARLGSVRLPEIVPWKLSPTPPPDRRVPCAARPKPQSIFVFDIITQALLAAANLSLLFPLGDPLQGKTYLEGERDYSTRGKTFDQVWGETYGQIGYVYYLKSTYLLALPSNAGYPFRYTQVTRPDVMGEIGLRGEAANTPNHLTVTGADLLLDRPNLIQLATVAPDMNSLIREISPDLEWYVTTPTDSGESIKGFRKSAGVITYTNELTRSDVTVKETVDGVEKTRTFSRVVTGYTSTESRYDPECTDALIYQRTIKRSYGYGLNTETHSAIFSGPGWGGGYESGDTLADEEQTINQSFSPEGYLQIRTTTTRKLASLQQQGADGPPADRGPLEAREYVTQILSETFQPLGGGKWLRLWSQSGAQQLPLYDTESGDAVRLASRGGTASNGQDILDQAPAQVSCPDPCTIRKAAYPQVVTRRLTDGREGQEVTRALPFVTDLEGLASYALDIAASLAPTLNADATLSKPFDWRPGIGLAGLLNGVVQTYGLEASGGKIAVKVGVRLITDSGSEVVPNDEGDGPFRDMVIWRSPGGVTVNHFKGIVDGTPKFDQIFVRATGANLPSPGDEIEWRGDLRFGPTATGNYGN